MVIHERRVVAILGSLLFLSAAAGRQQVPLIQPSIEVRILLIPLLAVSTLAWTAVTHRRRIRWPSYFYVVTGLFLLHAASSIWAEPGARVGTKLLDDGLILLLFWSVAAIALRAPEQMASAFVRSAFWVAVALASIAFLSGTSAGGRAAALGGGPNVFARIVVIGAVAALCLAWSTRRLWWLLPAPGLGVMALLSGSRGALAAAALVVAVSFVAGGVRLKSRTLLISAVMLGLWTAYTTVDSSRASQVSSRFDATNIESSGLSGRSDLWHEAFTLIGERPITGYGTDAFAARHASSGGLPYPHNVLLEVWVDVGIFGFAAAVGALLLAFAGWWSTRRADSPLLHCVYASGLFVFLASLFSGDLYDSRLAWIFLAVGVAGSASLKVTRLSSGKQRTLSRTCAAEVDLGTPKDHLTEGP